MSRLNLSVTALVAALAISACGGASGSSSDDEIVLGLIANKTGPAAGSYGIPFANGVELALSEIEGRGFLGDSGLSFKVVEADGGSELSGAITAYNTVTRDDAIAVLSDSQTPIASGISPLANDEGVLFLTGAGSKVENESGFTYVLTDMGTPLKSLGAYLHDQGVKRVAAIIDGDNPAFPTMATATEAGFVEAGGPKYVATETVATGDTDFSTVLTKIAASKPDVIQISTLAEQAGNVLRQMKQSGDLQGVLPIGSMGWSPQVYTVAKDAAKGSVFSLPWAPGMPESAEFETSYEDQFGEMPNAYSAVGYQAIWALAVAAEQLSSAGKEITADTLREILPKVSTSDNLKKFGLIHDFSLTEEGMPSYPGVLTTFTEDGVITTLK